MYWQWHRSFGKHDAALLAFISFGFYSRLSCYTSFSPSMLFLYPVSMFSYFFYALALRLELACLDVLGNAMQATTFDSVHFWFVADESWIPSLSVFNFFARLLVLDGVYYRSHGMQ